MSEVTIGLLGLAVVLVLFLTGIELAFAMALVGFIGFSFIVSFKAGFNLLAKDFFDVFASYGFTVIRFLSSWARSPLMQVLRKDSTMPPTIHRSHPRRSRHGHCGRGNCIKAICGSSPATAATFASVAVPEMDRYNYAKKLSTGIVATVGTLGILIPRA